jgi:homoserine dehydrogenase
MEALIKKIPGVHDASMNFLTQKLTLDAEDERFDEILAEAQKCCDKVDKGCRIVR